MSGYFSTKADHTMQTCSERRALEKVNAAQAAY